MHRSSPIAGALLVLLAVAGVLAAAPSAAAAPPPRHIGSSTIDEVRSAVARSVAEHAGCYGLTARRLEATALAIVYKESGSGLTKAPSPMTLSRFDVYKPDGGTFQRLNYGLYAFRDPNTPYQRAFWHPGVGVWQLDEAGLGADHTAAERISSKVSTSFIVDYLGDRWCSPGSPPTIREGRVRAWGDWGCRQSSTSANCQRLESIFLELYSDGGLDRLITDSVSDLGGALGRTCRMGDGAQLPCTYVDPARAQGDTWWASPTLSGATPIAAPFYVIEHNGFERRIWLKVDTGYGINITASRTMGRNSRPYQAGDGLTWASSSTLCDLTTGRGACDPNTPSPLELTPPAPIKRTVLSTPSGRTPVVGDYDGDGLEDILWYAPGATSDSLWLGTGNGTFTTQSTSVTGTYEPVVARLGPEGLDDILWHEPATGRVVRWRSLGNGSFAATTHWVSPGSTPLVGDFDGDGRDEVLWYVAGPAVDEHWDVEAGALVESERPVQGSYVPLVGDFDGNEVDDIFWYGPGTAGESIWMHASGGVRTSVAVTVKGSYRPAVGDFDGDGHTDVYWYQPGSGSDTIWYGVSGHSWIAKPQSLSGTYDIVVADVDGDEPEEMTLYAAGFASDRLWQFGPARARVGDDAVRIDGAYRTAPGSFGAPGGAGLLWAGPSGYSVVWHP